MNTQPVFKLHGSVDIDPSIIAAVTDYPWHSVAQSRQDDPLRPSNNLYVTLDSSLNINLPLGVIDNPLSKHLSQIVTQLHSVFVGKICLRAMIINLPSNTAQDWHVDPRVMHELSHRVHVALYTNANSVLEIEHQQQHFAVGEVWEINNLRPHRANNRGTSNRIHLITDWMLPDTYAQRQGDFMLQRAEVIDNLGIKYQSLSGKCLFPPEKS
jgi:hypothetical protein